MTGIDKHIMGEGMIPVFQKALKMNAHLKDALAIVIMIALFNTCISIAYDTLQYINIYKIIWAFIGGIFVFIPMYAIMELTLRLAKSRLLFLATSCIAWAVVPFIMSIGVSETLNAWQGSYQIYENGNLTRLGYIHGLQSPFFFLFLYAVVIFILYAYRNLKNKRGGLTNG